MIRQIAVLSGKGGAGKTSVTAALIQMLDQVVAVDADVNASNLPILTPHRVQQSHKYYGMDIAKISAEICNSCGQCMKVCRFRAIIKTEAGTYDCTDDCEGCAACFSVCPEKAVSMVPRQSGEWFRSAIDNGFLIHAELFPGEDNSGKLITRIRREATAVAKDKNISYIITDGPPGTSCQAMAAMTGNDRILAVVEESLSGLSDYRRLAELIDRFSIPHTVVINKAGFSMDLERQIEQSAAQFRGSIAGKIPFSHQVPMALQKLQTLTDLDICQDLFKKLREQLFSDP